MAKLTFEFSVIEMTDEQIEENYTLWPEINDPDYPKEIIAIDGEFVSFIMTIDTIRYICISNPHSVD